MKNSDLTPFAVAIVLTACGGADGPADRSPLPLEPPFSGTIFIDPDIITASDPTAFTGVRFAGQASRRMFDRRVADWITVEAFLFDATFDDGLAVEIQVNPEFPTEAASQVLAERYAEAIGRLPRAAHTSLDAAHRAAPGWLAAQDADPTFISTYARDFPNREDIAESIVPYVAVRFRPDRISGPLRAVIEETIPNRIRYFDSLGLDMHPIDGPQNPA